MTPKLIFYSLIILAVLILLVPLSRSYFNRFDLPRGEAVPLTDILNGNAEPATSANNPADDDITGEKTDDKAVQSASPNKTSDREIFVTDGVKHSIPINEILSGGPGKDGIPSIDNPKFISIKEADAFLDSDSAGLGLVLGSESRFYPYQILVWHEIVNDLVVGQPVLVTYCPLCATGIVFDRTVSDQVLEFGVSGSLWQSNLLMYNRTANPENESLWSQVLGEAVVGNLTGAKLRIIPSDTVTYGDWKKKYPQTKVLSRETGALRRYGTDPYGDYYTDQSVSFGATFSDDRLHPKAFVLGIEIAGQFKAYHKDALPIGAKTDMVAGQKITIEKSDIGEVRMFVGEDKKDLPYIGGFWFSWLAVHPETELFK